MAGPANQTCATATVVGPSLPWGDQVDTSASATETETAACFFTASYKAVWYSWTCPPGLTTLIVSTTGTQYQVGLAAFTGTCGSLTEVGCQVSEDSGGSWRFAVRLVLTVSAGTTYYVLAIAPENDGGVLTINFATAVTVTSSNFTPETAYELTCGPATLLEDVTSAPTGSGYTASCVSSELREVWFKWTAPDDMSFAINVRGTDDPDPDPNAPIAQAWTGTLASLSLVNVGFCANNLTTIVLPAFAGEDYYIQVVDGTGDPAACTLLFDFILPSDTTAPASGLFINADKDGVPASILSPVDGSILQIRPFPAGEIGNIVLSNATLCVIGGEAILGDRVDFYSSAFVLLATRIFTGQSVRAIGTNRSDTFYVCTEDNTTHHILVKQFSDVGTAGGTWDLGTISGNIGTVTVARDNSILYYTNGSQGPSSQTIHRYDLVGSAPLSNLAGTLGHVSFVDSFTGSTGTLFIQCKNTATAIVYGINPTTGATTFTYTGNADVTHMAPDPDDLSFWVWTIDNPTFIGRFVQVRISDGAILTDFTIPMAISTGYSKPNYFPWLASRSCPLMVLPATAPIGFPICPPSTEGPGTDCTHVWGVEACGLTIPGPLAPYAPAISFSPIVTTCAIRRWRQGPHMSNEAQWMFHSRFQLDLETGIGNDDAPDPEVHLQWSDDGGHTWTSGLTDTAGTSTDYTKRVLWNRLGRSRDRIYRIWVEDPVTWRLVEGYALGDPGIPGA